MMHSLLEEAEDVLHGLVTIDVSAGINGIDAPTFGSGPKLGLPHGMAVDVLDQDGLGEGRSVVDARAPIAVTAGTNLEEKGTVHLVFFRSMDPGQVPCSASRHGGSFRAVFFLKQTTIGIKLVNQLGTTRHSGRLNRGYTQHQRRKARDN